MRLVADVLERREFGAPCGRRLGIDLACHHLLRGVAFKQAVAVGIESATASIVGERRISTTTIHAYHERLVFDCPRLQQTHPVL